MSDPLEHYLHTTLHLSITFESWSHTVALNHELIHPGHFRTKKQPLKIVLSVQGSISCPVITARVCLWLSREQMLGSYGNATGVVLKHMNKGWLGGFVSKMKEGAGSDQRKRHVWTVNRSHEMCTDAFEAATKCLPWSQSSFSWILPPHGWMITKQNIRLANLNVHFLPRDKKSLFSVKWTGVNSLNLRGVSWTNWRSSSFRWRLC